MYFIYDIRLALKALGSRLWPFVLMLIIFMVLTSNDKLVHSVPLSREIFHFVQNDVASIFTGNTFEVIGWVFFTIFCLLIIRLILKSIASDKKLFRRLKQHVTSNPDRYELLLDYTPKDFDEQYGRANIYRFFDQMSEEIVDSHRYFQYRYTGATQLASPVSITYEDISLFESWRPKTVRNTIATVEVAPVLPEVLLISKLASARDSALKLRLARKDQYIELEGSFSRAFSVYIPRGQEVEALKLLAPNIMEILEPHAATFDIAFGGRTIAFMRNEYILPESKVEAFEVAIEDTLDHLSLYLKNETTLAKLKPRSDVTTHSAGIYPLNFISDRAVILWTALFIVAIVVSIIGGLFSHNREVFGYTYLTPFNDVMNLIILVLLFLMIITMLAGEIEVAIYRTIMYFKRRANLAYYRKFRH